MRYLLDTHTFIWLDNDPAKLSTTVASMCRDTTNTLLLSPVSVWEMQIKLKIGKLTLPAPLNTIIDNQIKNNRITLLPIELVHIYRLDNLPDHHRDPFDRLLVAQAQVEQVPILSRDSSISKYAITVVW